MDEYNESNTSPEDLYDIKLQEKTKQIELKEHKLYAQKITDEIISKIEYLWGHKMNVKPWPSEDDIQHLSSQIKSIIMQHNIYGRK